MSYKIMFKGACLSTQLSFIFLWAALVRGYLRKIIMGKINTKKINGPWKKPSNSSCWSDGSMIIPEGKDINHKTNIDKN